jgi:hypothetical protein
MRDSPNSPTYRANIIRESIDGATMYQLLVALDLVS